MTDKLIVQKGQPQEVRPFTASEKAQHAIDKATQPPPVPESAERKAIRILLETASPNQKARAEIALAGNDR